MSCLWGGNQTVLFGDFYQLPPVPNRFLGDSGNYAFQSPIWPVLCPHKVVLTQVQRQNDTQLISAIRETARGCPTTDTLQFLRTLSSEDPRQVHLAATRTDVHIINGEKLKELLVDAPINLALKLNAPVVLTVNLSHKLVNGLRGYVKEMNDSDVVVYFPDLKEMHTFGPYNFFVYSAKQKRNIFVTSQIPLILAFSLTIHNSQGMTLDSVCIECAGAFQAGQISVALVRVRAAKDITVMNFRPSLCPPHPPVVNAFYGTQSETVTANQSCCKLKLPACSSSVDVTSPVMESNADGSHPDETVADSETEDDCDDDSAPNNAYYLFCDDPQTDPQIQYPDELNGAYMGSAMVIDDPFTDTHTLMNQCLEDISHFDLFNISVTLIYSTGGDTSTTI